MQEACTSYPPVVAEIRNSNKSSTRQQCSTKFCKVMALLTGKHERTKSLMLACRMLLTKNVISWKFKILFTLGF